MGLTQDDFGKLLGISSQNVYQWERKDGPLRVREATKASTVGQDAGFTGSEGAPGGVGRGQDGSHEAISCRRNRIAMGSRCGGFFAG